MIALDGNRPDHVELVGRILGDDLPWLVLVRADRPLPSLVALGSRQVEPTRLDREAISVLLEHPEFTRIQVGAHLDDSAPEAKREEMTAARAKAVEAYLRDKGIGKNRLEAKGFGSAQPLVPNSSARNRAINRRIEFVIVTGAAKPE